MMSFQDDLQSARAAVASGQNFVYEGKTYTPARIVKELTGPNGVLTLRAQQELQVMQAQAGTVTQERNLEKRQEKATAQALERAKKKLKSLESNKNIFLQDFANNRITEAEYNARFSLVDQLTKDIAAMETGAPAVSIGGTSDPLAYKMLTPQETGTLAAQRTDIAGRTGFATPGQRTVVTPGGSPVGGPVQGPPSPFLDADGKPIQTDKEPIPVGAAVTTVKKADVDAALATSGLPDTPANRKQIREDLKAGKKPQVDWETRVRAEAGEYAYLLDPKFEGVPELLRKAVDKDWFDTPEGEKQFLQEFAKTPYALNADANQEKFDLSDAGTKRSLIEAQIDNIRSQYGEIQFDQTTLEEVATTAARNKSTNIELGRLVYRAAFKRGAAQPAFGESVAAKTALGGEDVARVRAIYRAYGQTADDQTIARVLAGEVDPASGVVMTEDMLRNNLRDIAKVSYKPFADLLDRGISVETIFQPYKQIAANVLEKTPDEVELIDASGKPSQFASALMMKEPMSLTDWITTLKSDERYGWQFTSEAKQKATSLVMDLEKAFGFRA
jgi:hypothetical protein